MLALQRVDLKIIVAVVLTQDHAGIDGFLHANEEVAAIFQFPHRIGDRNPGFDGNQHALTTPFDRAFVRGPVVEHTVQNAGAAGVGHELTVIADQAARRHMCDNAGLASTCWFHFHQIALARPGQFFDHGAGIFVIDVDRDFFDRLAFDAINIAEQHARAADRQLKPFATHVFDQNAHLQFTATGHFKGVTGFGVRHFDGDVDFGLFHQAFADHARLHLGAFFASERRIVDPESYRNCRRIHGMRGQRRVDFQSTQRVGDRGLGHAGKRHDVACFGRVNRRLGQAAEGQNLGYAELFDPLAVAGDGLDGLAGAQGACLDPAGQDAPDERVGRQRGGQHLERLMAARNLRRGRNVAHHQIEKCVQVLAGTVQFSIGPARATRGVKMREVELFVRCTKVCEEIKHFVQRARGFGVGLVDLVQNHNRAKAQRQRFGGHEFRLRHRAFGGVHQEHNAIDHRQDALHLSAKVGVAGGVDDVDPRALPFQRGAFGQNRDATFTLDVIAVHGAFGNRLIVAEGSGLFQQFVHQGGFAMVDVRDDGDVAKLHREGSLSLSALARALQEAGQKRQRNLVWAEIGRVRWCTAP